MFVQTASVFYLLVLLVLLVADLMPKWQRWRERSGGKLNADAATVRRMARSFSFRSSSDHRSSVKTTRW